MRLVWLTIPSAFGLETFWGDNILLSGGAVQLDSVALNDSHIRRDTFCNLPDAEYILVELYEPARCLTCTSLFEEYERAARGINAFNAAVGRAFGPARALLSPVAVNCAAFASLCTRFSHGEVSIWHREPFKSVEKQEQPHEHMPPAGWFWAWPTSTLILARREDISGERSSFERYWRLDSFSSAEDILTWLRGNLRGLPTAALRGWHDDRQGSREQMIQLLIAPDAEDQRFEALSRAGLVGHLSKHGCICLKKWKRCGYYLGFWKTCSEQEGCSEELKQCETLQPCNGPVVDSCVPGFHSETVTVFPKLHEGGSDMELALALWLHMAMAEAKFSLDQDNSTELSNSGLRRRSVLLDFIRLLCAYFPTDHPAVVNQDLRGFLHHVAADIDAASSSAQERRLWWWSSAGEPTDLRCRKSLCQLATLLERNWTSITSSEKGCARIDLHALESRWQLCKVSWYAWSVHTWKHCRGSFAGTRQLPCGIWLLLHTLVAHTSEYDAVVLRSVAVTLWDMLVEFFPCLVCVRTILETRLDIDIRLISSHKDLTLWLWRLHNQVAARVARQTTKERAFATDPAFPPDVFWPGLDLCPSCSDDKNAVEADGGAPSLDLADCAVGACMKPDVGWHLDRVYDYVSRYYCHADRGCILPR